MTSRRYWPLFASLLLSAAGCADLQIDTTDQDQIADCNGQLDAAGVSATPVASAE